MTWIWGSQTGARFERRKKLLSGSTISGLSSRYPQFNNAEPCFARAPHSPLSRSELWELISLQYRQSMYSYFLSVNNPEYLTT